MIDENDDRTVDEILENGTPEEKAWLIAKFDESDRKIAAMKTANEQALKDHLKANGITLESLNHHIQQIKDLNHDVAKVTSLAKEKGMTKKAFSELWQELKADFKMDSSLIFNDWYGEFKTSQHFEYQAFNFRLATELARLASGKVKAKPSNLKQQEFVLWREQEKNASSAFFAVRNGTNPVNIPEGGVGFADNHNNIKATAALPLAPRHKGEVTSFTPYHNDLGYAEGLMFNAIIDASKDAVAKQMAVENEQFGSRMFYDLFNAMLEKFADARERIISETPTDQVSEIPIRKWVIKGGLPALLEQMGYKSDKGELLTKAKEILVAGSMREFTLGELTGLRAWRLEHDKDGEAKGVNGRRGEKLTIYADALTSPVLLKYHAVSQGKRKYWLDHLSYQYPAYPPGTRLGARSYAAESRFITEICNYAATEKERYEARKGKSEGLRINDATLRTIADKAELNHAMIDNVMLALAASDTIHYDKANGLMRFGRQPLAWQWRQTLLHHAKRSQERRRQAQSGGRKKRTNRVYRP